MIGGQLYMNKRNDDELSSLLDSFQTDDTMERKMNDFARQKEQKSRTQQPHIRMDAEPRVRTERPVEDQGSTVVFDKVNVSEEPSQTEGTVMMDDQEIQSLLNESKGPQVRTDKPSKGSGSQKPPHQRKMKKKNDNAKKFGIVAGCIVGALLIAMILFGIIKFVIGGFEDSAEKQEENYERIVEFLDEEDYDLDRVRKFKELYDRLSDELQEDIDDEIYTITQGECANFEDLLEKAKEEKRKETKKEKDQKNETTKIAERKAEIKDEISKLKKQIARLEKEGSNSKELANAKKSLDAAIKKRDQAQADADKIAGLVNASYVEMQNIQAEIDTYTSQDETDLDNEDMAYLQSLYGKMNSVRAELERNQAKLDTANAVLAERESVVAEKQAIYDEIENGSSGNEEQIRQLQAQIDELEQELRELDRK